MTAAELLVISIKKGMQLLMLKKRNGQPQIQTDRSNLGTFVVFFVESTRTTDWICVDNDPNQVLEQLNEALKSGWEPIAVQICEKEPSEDCPPLGVRYFSEDPSIEHQAVIDSIFEG